MQIWLFIVPEGSERALGISDWCSFRYEMWASRFLSFWALVGLLWVFRLSGLLGWPCVPLDFWTSGFCTFWLLGFRTFELSLWVFGHLGNLRTSSIFMKQILKYCSYTPLTSSQPEAMTMASRLCRETQTSLCIKNPANITAIRKQ